MSLDFNWNDIMSKTNFKEKKQFEADKRFWKLEADESGKGRAVVRFLLDKNGVPFVNINKSGLETFDTVKKKKVWYIRDLPDAIGIKSPLNEFRKKLYDLGTTEAEEEAKNFRIQSRFIGNVYVIKDPANPDNEGKVFLFDFGKQILDKLQMAATEEGVNVWNPLKEGADVMIRRNIKDAKYKVPTFENTQVQNQGSFNDIETSEEAEKFIKSNTYDLQEFIDPDHFEPYEELKKGLKFFCSKYTPKCMSEEAFADVVADYFGEENNKTSFKAKTQTNVADDDDAPFDEEDEVVEAKPAKKEEKKPAKKVEDDIDDLLDEDEPKPAAKKEEKKASKKVADADDDDIDALLAEL